MKSFYITLFLLSSLIISPELFAQNVSVNADGSLADTSAILDVNSTSKGVLLPRMTTAQQNAIILPAKGLTIFNSSLNSIMLNTGTSGAPVWSALAAGSIDTTNIANFYVKTRSLISSTAPITYSNGLIGLSQAGTSTNGYLNSTDWNTFNNKVDATALTPLAPKSSPTLTGIVVIPTPFTIGATSMTASAAQLNYLNSASGTTGTASTNLVFSTSPVFTTPRLAATSTSGYVWTATDALGNGSWQNSPAVASMAAIGSTPNANGASISGGTLTLQPANATNGGVVTTGTQTIAGDKTFSGDVMPQGRLMLPMGEVSYFSTTGTNITITSISDGSTNMVTASPATTLANYKDFDNGGSNNGSLRYTGATTKDFHIACTVSFGPNTISAATFVFGIAKNGAVIASSKVLQRLSSASTDINSTALHVMVTLATNDVLTFKVGNITGTGDITLFSINLFAMGM